MNLRKHRGSKVLKTKTAEGGFTLIEVMVSLAIVTMIGLAIWGSFASGVKLLHAIPGTGETNIDLIKLEVAFRRNLENIQFPVWVPEYEPSDDDYIELPFLYGYKDYLLFLYAERKEYTDEIYFFIEGNKDEMDKEIFIDEEFGNFQLKFGPYKSVRFEYVTDDDDFLKGIEITVEPMQENYGEATIYGKIGGNPFWYDE